MHRIISWPRRGRVLKGRAAGQGNLSELEGHIMQLGSKERIKTEQNLARSAL